jgi:hypothetical protein
MKLVTLCTAAALMIGGAALADPASPLAGRWVQSSSGSELVLKPKIKLTPSYTASMGTSLGGSVGYASATTTVLATEPTLTKVDRRMELTVQADGRFHWVVVREWADGACRRSVRQEKRGRLTLTGQTASFSTSEGQELSRNSCAAETRSAMKPMREDYAVARTAAGLRLTGAGTDWTFASTAPRQGRSESGD